MIRFISPRRLVPAALAVLIGSALVAGCSKKVTNADPTFTQLEGRQNADARLVVWPDTPNNVLLFNDLAPPGPPANPGDPTDDTILTVTPTYVTGPGAVQTMLLDGTAASAYQMYRKAGNGGLEPTRDFVLNASRKWLDSQWEVYQLADATPSGYNPATYVARGIVGGAATPSSPITNEAEISAPAPTRSITYTETIFPRDSLFNMAWSAVPGAAGYWLHVYQFRSDATNRENILSGTPSPVWNGKVRDFLVGYVAAPATSYKFGAPGALILTRKNPLFGQEYLVRITAVDAMGQLIAYTEGDTGFVQQETTYEKFLLAARKVQPKHLGGAPAFGTLPAVAGVRTGEFGIPGFGIISRRQR